MNVIDQTAAILILHVVIIRVPTHAIATQVITVMAHLVIIKMSVRKEVTIAIRMPLVGTEPLTTIVDKNSYAHVRVGFLVLALIALI